MENLSSSNKMTSRFEQPVGRLARASVDLTVADGAAARLTGLPSLFRIPHSALRI